MGYHNDFIIEQNAVRFAYFVLGLKAGLLKKEQVITWADAVIAREDAPHELICELSLFGKKDANELISFLREMLEGHKEVKASGRALLALLYEKFSSGKLPLRNTIGLIRKIVIYDGFELHDVFSDEEKGDVYSLDDAYDLAEENIVGSIEEVRKNTIAFLKQYERFRENYLD